MQRLGAHAARFGAVVGLLAAALSTLAGCASYQSSQARAQEQILVTAGFSQEVADTPAERARLLALPKAQLIERAGPDGEPTYLFPDPDNCCCTYVGDAAQHAAYLALEARIKRERERDAEVVLFGDSAMYAHVAPDYPKLLPLPPDASGRACSD